MKLIFNKAFLFFEYQKTWRYKEGGGVAIFISKIEKNWCYKKLNINDIKIKIWTDTVTKTYAESAYDALLYSEVMTTASLMFSNVIIVYRAVINSIL